MWVRDRDRPLMVENPSTIDCYRTLIEAQDYSYLMNDGAVIQIALTYDGRRIARHRFLYHPCPFLVTKGELDKFGGELLDFIDDTFIGRIESSLLLRSPVRFDYAPDAATASHPASHLTLNGPDCRIPARFPIRFDVFMGFVLRNFYPDALMHRKVPRLRQHRHEDQDCLSARDRVGVHLSWESARSGRRSG